MLDSPDFYADCRALLSEDGCMTVNLFGRSSSFERSLQSMATAFGEEALWAFKPTREGNTVVLAQRTPSRPKRAELMARAEVVQERWGLPATKWLRVFKPVVVEEGQGGTGVRPGLLMLSIPAGLSHVHRSSRRSPRFFCCCIHRPLVWRKVVDWLSADGVISADEAQRTIARCSQAESAQNPLVRLSNVAMARASDGRPLDIEALTEYVAQRAGLPYLRIDPLRVDVGRVADTMSATYAERHRCCLCRSRPPKWWWPRPSRS